jgi:hypothetical protein
MSQRENLKLQGSPIAERRAQGQEQRDDDGSHRRRPYPRRPARSMFSGRTEFLVVAPGISRCSAARERTSERTARSTDTTTGITDRRLFDAVANLNEFAVRSFW